MHPERKRRNGQEVRLTKVCLYCGGRFESLSGRKLYCNTRCSSGMRVQRAKQARERQSAEEAGQVCYDAIITAMRDPQSLTVRQKNVLLRLAGACLDAGSGDGGIKGP